MPGVYRRPDAPVAAASSRGQRRRVLLTTPPPRGGAKRPSACQIRRVRFHAACGSEYLANGSRGRNAPAPMPGGIVYHFARPASRSRIACTRQGRS